MLNIPGVNMDLSFQATIYGIHNHWSALHSTYLQCAHILFQAPTVLVTNFWHFSACKNYPYSVFDIFDVLSVCKLSRFVGISLILHELHSPWFSLEEAQLNPTWLYLPSGPLFTLISQLTIQASGHCNLIYLSFPFSPLQGVFVFKVLLFCTNST